MTLLVDKNVDSVAMDEDSGDESRAKKAPSRAALPLPLPPNPEHVLIRRDYDPKARHQAAAAAAKAAAAADTFFKSPLTGELVPAAAMSEHMRISTLEEEQREDQEEVLDTGFHIEEDLRQLAEYRSGVVAKGDDEAVIGKRVGEAGAHTVILRSGTWWRRWARCCSSRSRRQSKAQYLPATT